MSSHDPLGAFIDRPPATAGAATSGPLAGCSLAVKDLFDVEGFPTGGGHPLRRALAPAQAESATVVRTLIAAGAHFVGKTHTDEFAYAMNGENPHYGMPTNPRAPGRITGGSSSGSAAAVAGGLADIALGTDTGGSIRLPASYCGLIGLRPSHGRIDGTGLQPLARSFDTVGWFARTAAIYAEVGRLLLPEVPSALPFRRLVVADDLVAFVLGDAERQAFERAVGCLGEHLAIDGSVRIAPEGLAGWRSVFRTIQAYEAWADHGAWIVEHQPELGDGVRERFAWARTVTAEDYEAARAERMMIMGSVVALLPPGTGLVFPTAPAVAPRSGMKGEELESYRQRSISMLCPAGLSGCPQISLPLATVDGLPFGISILGGPDSDHRLIDVALELFGDR